MAPTVEKEGLFWYFLLLTTFFFLLEISFFIQCNKAYLSDFTFVTHELHLPLTMLPGVLLFIGAQLLLHFGYCFLTFWMTLLIAELLRLSETSKIILGVFIWFAGICTVLVANAYYFPNSKFAGLLLIFIRSPTWLANIYSYLLILFALLIMLAAIPFFFKLLRYTFYLALFGSVTFIIYQWYGDEKAPISFATAARPNIILIGVDSLRPDFLSFFGNDIKTPFFDRFLSESTVFTEAITPLARTFPSWASILTGQYPNAINLRFNLANQDHAKILSTLPIILQHQGYETVFATDETRFSNIDKNFGFDKIISPPMGLNDFLLGTFNDFPLSNLLVNTVIGRWVFPYSYANRPVYFTYEPTSFIKMLKGFLSRPHNKPLFFAVHFCLTHYPYLWASLPGNSFNVWERYQASVPKVDEQVHLLYQILQKYRLLDHAIVILLSDHGEALELPGDRLTEAELFYQEQGKVSLPPKFYPPSLDNEAINQSSGHGTDVLGLPQYHTLLAFRLYGFPQLPQPEKVTGVVSLIDLKPTILAMLGLRSETMMQGISLAPVIFGDQDALPLRHLFLESDFSPEAIRTVYPEARQVLLEGISLFEINPATTRLTVKPKMGQMTIASKQYADIYGEWMLALYPQGKKIHMPILINLKTGQWTNNLNSNFALTSPAKIMLDQLKLFYREEISEA